MPLSCFGCFSASPSSQPPSKLPPAKPVPAKSAPAKPPPPTMLPLNPPPYSSQPASSSQPKRDNPPAPQPTSSSTTAAAASSSKTDDYQPPPGPPPSQQHDWQTAVPDTSLLPPPPSLGFESSPANNASASEAEAGEAWCRQWPLAQPLMLSPTQLQDLRIGNVRLAVPPQQQHNIKPQSRYYNADGNGSNAITSTTTTTTTIRTPPTQQDVCYLTTLPLYSAAHHSPSRTNRRHTIYYEIQIGKARAAREIGLALGFVAAPYPSFRLPGWHRASLAVHGDDGHRYVNDRWGGKAFAAPFKGGERIGIGMVFSPFGGSVDDEIGTSAMGHGRGIAVEVFLTRNGVWEGGWDLNEELDGKEDLGVDGLRGDRDLWGCVGVFGEVAVEAVFGRAEWLYVPEE